MERELDKSQLRLNAFRYKPHKDYLSHVLRYGHIVNRVKKGYKMLDIGCGQDAPVANSMGASMSVPSEYIGIDLNRTVKYPDNKQYVSFLLNQDFTSNDCLKDKKYLSYFNLIICLECFEHMSMDKGRKLLKKAYEYLKPSGQLLFSTPVYCSSYGTAKNHINEITKSEIETEFHRAGFIVKEQYGMNINKRDLKKVIDKDIKLAYNKLEKFFGPEILGTIFAAMYPEASRNIFHVCAKSGNEMKLKDSVVKESPIGNY